MELELFILFVIVVGVIWLRRRFKRREEYNRYENLPRDNKRWVRRKSFDPSGSKPSAKQTVLKGSAYVVDGDTIVIQKTQIRLFGIDAPEINHPYGQKAKWALVSLCKGKPVHAEIVEEDSHGRTVAKCYLKDGRDLSAEMVKLGLAIDWPKFSGGKYQALEVPQIRKKLWLADARQKGHLHVWKRFEERQISARIKN